MITQSHKLYSDLEQDYSARKIMNGAIYINKRFINNNVMKINQSVIFFFLYTCNLFLIISRCHCQRSGNKRIKIIFPR